MNVGIKIIRYSSKEEKDGKAPLALRITKMGIRKYIWLNHRLAENEWDEESSTVRKNHPNSRRLNISLSAKFTEAEQILLDLENKNIDLSTSQIKELIKSGGFNFISFNKLSKEYLKGKEKADKYNQIAADKGKFKSFLNYLELEGLAISDNGANSDDKNLDTQLTNEVKKNLDFNVKNITGHLLKDYQDHLKGLGNSKATIYNKLNIVRIIYNMAVSKKLIDRKDYPFGKGVGQIQLKPGEGTQVGMDENQLDAFEFVDLSINNPVAIAVLKEGVKYIKNINERIQDLIHARNVYMISFYFAGERVGDTFRTRWSDFRNGRYYYTIGKNQLPIDVPIPVQITEILKYYEKDKRFDDDYVFPELKKANPKDSKDINRKIRTGNKKLNESLDIIARIAKIDFKPTIHSSRHSFGGQAKTNIPIEVLQLLYRHSDIKTTINYQKRIVRRDTLDAGLLKVVNLRNQKDITSVA